MCNLVYMLVSGCGGTKILAARHKQQWNQISIGINLIGFHFDSRLFDIFMGLTCMKDISSIIIIIVSELKLCTRFIGYRDIMHQGMAISGKPLSLEQC